MKKKVLCFVLAASMVVPCAVALTACSEQTNPTTETEWSTAVAEMNNYSVKGGVSKTDVDYGEYYFAEDGGFRMYTPNNTLSNRQDAYIEKVKSEYIKYTKQTDGSGWVIEKITESVYTQTTEAVKSTYLYFLSDALYSSYETTGKKITNKEEITQSVGTYTYHYYDVQIKLDNDNKISSANWKQKITVGASSSYEYSMELSVGDVRLTYPDAKIVGNEETWNWLFNFNNYTPVTISMTKGENSNFAKVNDTMCYVKTVYNGEIDENYGQRDGDKYYAYSKVDNKWSRHEISKESYEEQFDMNGMYLFSNMTYDAATGKYVGTVYGQSAECTISNGRVVKVVVGTTVVDFSYGDVEITLPTVSD